MKVIRIITSLWICLLLTSSLAQDLSVWGLPAFKPEADEYIASLLEEFGEANGIKAEYVVVPADVLNERLAAAFEAGSPPDAYMTISTQAQYYASQGLTQPLDDVLETMRAVDGGVYENLVPQGLYNDQIHALPIEVDVVPMYARTDLLEQAGVSIPTTWEELHEAVKAIRKDNPQYVGFGLTISNANDGEGAIRNIIWSFGGSIFDDVGNISFDSPETVAAYQFLADMFADGSIPRSALSWDDAGNNSAYQAGQAVFVINPPSIYSWMLDNDQELLANTQLINIPEGPGEKGRSGAGASSFVWQVPATTPSAEMAKKWLDYFFEAERYEKIIETVGGRWVPIYKDMISMPLFADNPQYSEFGKMAESGIVAGFKAPPSVLASEISNAKIVTTVGQKIFVDSLTAEEAVAWGQAEMQKLAAE